VGHVRPELFRGAQAIFFEGNIMSSKELPDSGAAARNAPFLHRGDDLLQRQIRLLGNHGQRPFRALFQRRMPPSSREEAPSRNMRQGVAEAAQRKRTQCPTGVVNPTVTLCDFARRRSMPLAIGRY
jgi:hypothetical protein